MRERERSTLAHKPNDGLLCRAGEADDAVSRAARAVRERRVLQLRDEPGGDEKGDGEELDCE